MVEHQTPNQDVLGSIPTGIQFRHINSPVYWFIPRKKCLCPDMTEKLLNGNQTNKHDYEKQIRRWGEN